MPWSALEQHVEVGGVLEEVVEAQDVLVPAATLELHFAVDLRIKESRLALDALRGKDREKNACFAGGSHTTPPRARRNQENI